MAMAAISKISTNAARVRRIVSIGYSIEYNSFMFKLIMGLGNPGEHFENTYHNIGLIFLASFARSPWRRVSRKHFMHSEKDGAILIKSTNFMNESGIAAREALKYFKIIPASLLVAHDDSDLFWGSYKLSLGQGAAGHKGVESIIYQLNTQNFWRLRIGIRQKSESRVKAEEFVLKKLTKEHHKELAKLFLELKTAIEKA